MTVTNAAGQSVSRSVTLTVASAPPTPTAALRITAPAAGAALTAPASLIVEAVPSNVSTTLARVSFYANGALIGTATQAPYRVTWHAATAGVYSLTAQAFSATGSVAAAPAVPVTVAAPGTATPPAGAVSISLTAPAANTVVPNQSTVTLAATAVDPAASITKVEFYRGSTNIGTSFKKPFTLRWSHVTTGTYVLTARAYNARGVVATSAPVTIHATQPPTVRLTAPSATSFRAPASVTIAAAATDVDGTVARVEFYRGTTLIGQSTRAPFTVVWSAPAAGVHVLTARAFDNRGLATTSAPVSVTIIR
jgi:hypothetical protein